MKPRGLHASDTHLRPRPDELFAFTQLVDAAIEHKVKYVMLAGDLLDRQTNRAKVVSFLYRQLSRLQEAGIRVFYTQGQHDFDDPPWFSGLDWPTHIHKKRVPTDDGAFYGLDWQPFGKLQEELAEIPSDVDFLVCHQVWANWMGDIAAPQGSFDQIPGQIRFVQTGDLHSWKLEKHKNADDQKMLVLSTGATTQQTVAEPQTHHYALRMADGSFEKKTLKSRVFVDCGLLARAEDLDKFVAELEPTLAEAHQKGAAMDLPPELMTPVFRVSYHAKVFDTVRRVEKIVGGRAVLRFKELPPEEKTVTYAQAKKKGGIAVTPLSMLAEEVDKEEEPATYELCERLLGAPDKELEFAKWRQEFLGEVES